MSIGRGLFVMVLLELVESSSLEESDVISELLGLAGRQATVDVELPAWA